MTKSTKLIAIGTLAFFISLTANSQSDSPQVKNVSGIKVVNYAGLKPLLERKNDTTYIVNFWATWCAPCIRELPYFQKIQDKFKDQKVKVLLVSLDFEKHIDTKLVPFIKKNNLTPEVVVLSDPASNEWIDKIDPSWSGALPVTLFVTKNDRRFFEKEFTYEEIRKVIFEMNPQLR
ncbi:MAG TPA: TlpA disulfide reductase family protein [Lentimicrobium sp.]|nr:TlpA disulfide reductase family protein [Lentimicrobium sp.]